MSNESCAEEDIIELLGSHLGNEILSGITRAAVLRFAKEAQMQIEERPFTLDEALAADEAFVTGTFAGLTPVFEVDGRTLTHTQRGPMVDRLQALYKELVVSESRSNTNRSR